MSSAIAVKHPQPEKFLHNSEPSVSTIGTKTDPTIVRSVRSVAVKTSPVESFSPSDLEARLREALKERDEQWRRHERSQIQFLQSEGAAMLKGLHEEIERLSNLLREARRKLDVGDDDVSEKEQLRQTIQNQEHRISQLEHQLAQKKASMSEIERKVNTTIEKMSDTIKIQSDRIRQLTGELQDRTLTVTQLSGQLRTYRLREAMATAQHRRRASQQSLNGSSPPLVSPSSPHRLFPPKSLLTGASVSVTYPGSMSKSAVLNPDVEDAGIEKPKTVLRRKSANGYNSMYKN